MLAHAVDLQQNPNLPYDHPYIGVKINGVSLRYLTKGYIQIVIYDDFMLMDKNPTKDISVT